MEEKKAQVIGAFHCPFTTAQNSKSRGSTQTKHSFKDTVWPFHRSLYKPFKTKSVTAVEKKR